MVRHRGVRAADRRAVRQHRTATSSTARAARTSTSRCSARSRWADTRRLEVPAAGGQPLQPSVSTTTRRRSFTSGTFGQITGISGNRIRERQIQLGLRFSSRSRTSTDRRPRRAHRRRGLCCFHAASLPLIANPSCDPVFAARCRVRRHSRAAASRPRPRLVSAGGAGRHRRRAYRGRRARPSDAAAAGALGRACRPGSNGTPRTQAYARAAGARAARFDWRVSRRASSCSGSRVRRDAAGTPPGSARDRGPTTCRRA